MKLVGSIVSVDSSTDRHSAADIAFSDALDGQELADVRWDVAPKASAQLPASTILPGSWLRG